jgi:hypothetical protein
MLSFLTSPQVTHNVGKGRHVHTLDLINDDVLQAKAGKMSTGKDNSLIGNINIDVYILSP